MIVVKPLGVHKLGHYHSEMYSAYSDPQYAVSYDKNRRAELCSIIESNPLNASDLAIGQNVKFYENLFQPSNVRITKGDVPKTRIIDNLYLILPGGSLDPMQQQIAFKRIMLRNSSNETLESIDFSIIGIAENKVSVGTHWFTKQCVYYPLGLFEPRM